MSTEAESKQERREILKKGYAILRGLSASLDQMEKIAYRARDFRAFSLARKLLALARQHPDAAALLPPHKLKLRQQHGICTYKDDDLVADERLSEALRILSEGDLLDTTPSQETLGLAGSIYKQRWRYTGQRSDLEQSLHYYQRAAAAGLAGDSGYTQINAAFVLDLLAKLERDLFPESARTRRRQASELREDIVARLPVLVSIDSQWWYGATMAEALFGLGRYPEAQQCLQGALALDPPAWQLESTTRQMSALARARDVDIKEGSEAWSTIRVLVGNRIEALRAMAMGKVGLALSGGGFRASLFHIGILARLAELDVLRHVEVLSCVSGGSIIGTHYYLEVRRLLKEKLDSEITREDYIEAVKRLERDFLAGVQMNLRSRMLAGWKANLRSIFEPGYTRTTWLGELMEKHIFARVKDGGGSTRFLDELQIAPKDVGPDFNPKLDNWRRAAKVPILLLNATTLNTGHVWQFAVTWMGEPPISASRSIDSNDLLRRMYYDEAPETHRRVRLGKAVTASACVPGLFDPVEMDGLFPHRRVRLVDGGVHDNQGVAGLLEQECSVLLVSDASGQMTSKPRPGTELLTVLKRTQNISMERIRVAEFQQLDALKRSSALIGLMFLHLKKDLETQHVDWVDCQDPYDSSANPGSARRGTTLTTYGMPRDIQTLLAELRTDLDTFSDAEAYALMLSGYRMATRGFKDSLGDFPIFEASPQAWGFRVVESAVDRTPGYDAEYERLRAALETGTRIAFKVWRLRPASALFRATVLLVPAALALVWLFLSVHPHIPHRPYLSGEVALGALGAAGLCILFLVVQYFRGRKSLTVILIGLIMVTVGWAVARLHLWFFDPLYRSAGRIQ